MRHPGSFLLGMSLALLPGGTLRAQDESDKINSNVGAAISLPLTYFELCENQLGTHRWCRIQHQ